MGQVIRVDFTIRKSVPQHKTYYMKGTEIPSFLLKEGKKAYFNTDVVMVYDHSLQKTTIGGS